MIRPTRPLAVIAALAVAAAAQAVDLPVVDLRFELSNVPSGGTVEVEESSTNATTTYDLDGNGGGRFSLLGLTDIVAPYPDEAGFGFAMGGSYDYALFLDRKARGFDWQIGTQTLNLHMRGFYKWNPNLRLEFGVFGGVGYAEQVVTSTTYDSRESEFCAQYGARCDLVISQERGPQLTLGLGWLQSNLELHEQDPTPIGTPQDIIFRDKLGGAIIALGCGWRF